MSGWHEALVERSARVAATEESLLRADMIDDFQRDQNDKLATHVSEADVYTELNGRHREMM
ncbi:uncharacterized protein TrAtP1_003408 [Trichoderma atroviride]|uniref:uncharacterized protein n=1 Tax=Hypocrea atroviridis TaxID=63577 RepID=UPI003318F9C6|nr:hypothetical protein TrAtP1_003408 [Trichoderma atroviride]